MGAYYSGGKAGIKVKKGEILIVNSRILRHPGGILDSGLFVYPGLRSRELGLTLGYAYLALTGLL